jgi:hypothetical protein
VIVYTHPAIRPPARYDDTPWAGATLEEAETADGDWAEIDSFAFDTPDTDPSKPAIRYLTTTNATEEGLWYRVVFYDDATEPNLSAASLPVQNLPGLPAASVEELARLLNQSPEKNWDALNRAIGAATYEIMRELGRVDPLTAPELQLVGEVTLERSMELYEKLPQGIVGLGSEMPLRVSRWEWERHAQKLAAAKQTWGMA